MYWCRSKLSCCLLLSLVTGALGAWSEWGAWTGCDGIPCGQHQVRKRLCDGAEATACEGESKERRICVSSCPEVWSEWSPWTRCRDICGVGEQRRLRQCRRGNRPATCSGDVTEKRECSTNRRDESLDNYPLKTIFYTPTDSRTNEAEEGETAVLVCCLRRQNQEPGKKLLVRHDSGRYVDTTNLRAVTVQQAFKLEIRISPLEVKDSGSYTCSVSPINPHIPAWGTSLKVFPKVSEPMFEPMTAPSAPFVNSTTNVSSTNVSAMNHTSQLPHLRPTTRTSLVTEDGRLMFWLVIFCPIGVIFLTMLIVLLLTWRRRRRYDAKRFGQSPRIHNHIHHIDGPFTHTWDRVPEMHCKGHTFNCACAAKELSYSPDTVVPLANKKSVWSPAGQRRPSRKVKKTLSEQLAKRSARSADKMAVDSSHGVENVYSPAEAERAFSRSLSEGTSLNFRLQATPVELSSRATVSDERIASSTDGSLAECGANGCADNVSESKLDDDEALFEDIMAACNSAIGNVNELLDTDSMMFGGSRASGFSRQLNINRLRRQYSLPLESRQDDGDDSSINQRRLSRSYGDYVTNDFMADESADSFSPRTASDEFGELSSLQLPIGEISTLPKQPPAIMAQSRSHTGRVTVL